MLHSDIVHIFVVFLQAGLLNLRNRLFAREPVPAWIYSVCEAA